MKRDMVVKLLLVTALISSSIVPFSGYVIFLAFFFYSLVKGELKELICLLIEEKLILCFFLISIFSLIISDYKIDSLLGLGVIFVSIVMYLVIRKYVYSINDTIDIYKYFIISNIIISTYGIIQFYFMKETFFASGWIDSKVYSISMRAYSSMLNPNVLAGYLVFCICLQLTSLEKIRYRKINILTLILSSFCLILTYSRGAWLTLLIVAFLIFFYRKKVIYILYSSIFFISIILINGNTGIERISLSKSLHDHSLQYRLEIYKSTLKIIREHFLFGSGLNTMRHYIDYYSEEINSSVYHAHNLILNILGETGFIGLIFFGIILINLINSIYFIYKLENRIYEDIAISSILGFLSILIHGFIDAAIIAPQFLFFVVFVYSLVMNIKHNNSIKEKIAKPCSSNTNNSGGELYGTRDTSIKKSNF